MISMEEVLFRSTRLNNLDDTFLKDLTRNLPNLEKLKFEFCNGFFNSGEQLIIFMKSLKKYEKLIETLLMLLDFTDKNPLYTLSKCCDIINENLDPEFDKLHLEIDNNRETRLFLQKNKNGLAEIFEMKGGQPYQKIKPIQSPEQEMEFNSYYFESDDDITRETNYQCCECF